MGASNGGERMRVAFLRLRQFKCVEEVEIAPTGDIIRISGDVGQGKTSILEAIETALCGGDQTLVRRGADKTELFIEVGDLKVSRSIDLDGKERLAVTQDGHALKTGQAKALLEQLYGVQLFRPMEWVQLSGGDARGSTERRRRQRDELLHALPLRLDEAELVQAVQGLGPEALQALQEMAIDLDLGRQHGLVACETLRRACYDARSATNRQQEDATAKLKGVPVPPTKVPADDLETLRRQERTREEAYQRALGAQKAQAATRSRAVQLRESIEETARILGQAQIEDEGPIVEEGKRVAEEAARIVEQIAELQRQLSSVEQQREQLRKSVAGMRERNGDVRRRQQQLERDRRELVDLEGAIGGTSEDPESLRVQLERAKEATWAKDLAVRYSAGAAEVERHATRSRVLGQLVDLFREALPGQLLQRAAFPVPGLGLDGDQITINGIPIHRLGTSEQIRLGVRVAVALNPQAGFVCVDGAESLGASGRKDLAAAAAEFGVQLWMSEVSETPGPGSIVMRAGVAQEVGS